MYNKNQEENNAIQNQRQGRYIMSSGQPDKNGSTKNNYKHLSDIRKVIRYISRSAANSNSDDLVCYGAINANSRSIENTINDFESTHSFARPCKGYRYLYHEIYYFTDILTPYIELKEVNFPKLAKKLAKKIATDGDNNHHYQVAYAIHEKTQSEKTHIHFVVNSIDFVTFNKRRLLYSDLKRHESNLNQIVFDYIENELK